MKLTLLIEDPDDVNRVTQFLVAGRSLRITVDTDTKKLFLGDEGPALSYFIHADMEVESLTR